MTDGVSLTQQAQVQEGFFDVPAVDSADNEDWGDVIGGKQDTHNGNSLYSRVDELYDAFQLERKVYPTLAAGATVVSANADWAYGAYATVVPINTIAADFHITAVSIESCDKNAVFQLELYKGAADDIITAVRFAVAGGFFGNQVYILGSEEVAANSQIRARLASSDGLANQATITISVVYWEHD
jgi:hypothetical protein